MPSVTYYLLFMAFNNIRILDRAIRGGNVSDMTPTDEQ